jgi:hypothetical protein
MKLKFQIIIISVLTLINCAHQISQNNGGELVKHSIINYPVKIEFGAIGKGSKLPLTTFEINFDSVRISTTKKTLITEIQNFSIATKQTKFGELLSNLEMKDIKGDKHYFNPYIRDGGYMIISYKHGNRRFTNTFSKISDKSRIKPDTIGLDKFENISKYALQLLKESGN